MTTNTMRTVACGCVVLMVALLMSCSEEKCEFEITTDTLPGATLGEAYSFKLTTGCAADRWYLEAGSLPPGIALSEKGVLSGTPTQAGDFIFTVTAVFADVDRNHYVSKGFSLRVT